jgi:cell wall-associated NlpC family hydrolase
VRAAPLKHAGAGADAPGVLVEGPPLPIETQSTGYAQAIARVREIVAPLAPAPAPAPAGFADRLASAMGASPPGGLASAGGEVPGAFGAATVTPGGPAAPALMAGAGGTGQRIAAIATAELGVSEQPLGSNDGPRIAEYRTATAGSGVGPWCAYFTSWVAARAGVSIGRDGSGLGYVPTVKRWAEDTGRYIPAGAGAAQVGDLVVFDRGGDGVLDHIGVVTGVSPDGGIQTVEGNSSDRVSARSYGPGGYAGLVRLVPAGG